MPFPKPIGDLTKQQLKALKKKVKKVVLKPAIKKLQDLKKKVIKIKGVKLASEFPELLGILLQDMSLNAIISLLVTTPVT